MNFFPSTTTISIWLLIGLTAGVLGGLFGLGGGFVVVPILVLLMGLSQTEAQGTSLAMLLPPVGIFALWQYHQNGHIRWPMAMWMALGFLVGGFFGGKVAQGIDPAMLKKAFAVTLALMSIKMFFSK